MTSTPSITIVGAGSVGGHIAARLAGVCDTVRVIARGAHLAAIQANGLKLTSGDTETIHRLPASDQPAEFGIQDIVIMSVKFRHLATALSDARPLIGPETRVVFAINGLPAWFVEGTPLAGNADILAQLDPGGAIAGTVPQDQAVACSVTSGGARVAAGHIRNTTPKMNKLVLGFHDGRDDPLISRLVTLLSASGYDAQLSSNIRTALWHKMIFNAALAPISTVTNRTAKQTTSDPETRALAIASMGEVTEIGKAIGITIDVNAEALTDPERAPDHKPSFLADLEAGIPLEISNGVLAVRAIARAAGVAAPHLITVAALMNARSPKES